MNSALATLRDRATSTAEFRRASDAVCSRLLEQVRAHIRGLARDSSKAVIVIILRSGIALLDSAMRTFKDAPVGVVGLKRDEITHEPRWYYENLPPLSGDSTVIILDPMLATGGSAEAVAMKLKEHGTNAEHIYFAGIVGAPEGFARLSRLIPEKNIILASLDQGLDEHAMIVPGLGDFGDRYFGYAG